MYVSGNNSDRPGTIACILTKLNQNSKLGLTFKREKKRVVINEVRGMAKRQTCLIPGLTLLSIDGVSIETVAQAKLLMETAPAGSNISIVVEGQIYKAKKLRRRQKVGLTIKYTPDERNGENGRRVRGLKIAAVSENSMFPYIPVGQEIFAINGKRVTKMAECVKLLLHKRKLTLMIVPSPLLATQQQQRSKKIVVVPEITSASSGLTSIPTWSTTSSIPSVVGDEEMKSTASHEVVSEEVSSGSLDNIGATTGTKSDDGLVAPQNGLPTLAEANKHTSRTFISQLFNVCGGLDDTVELISKLNLQEQSS